MKNKKSLVLILLFILSLSGCINNTQESIVEKEVDKNAQSIMETKVEIDLDSDKDTNLESNEKSKSKVSHNIEFDDYRSKKDVLLKVNNKEITYERFYKYFDLYSSLMAINQNLANDLTNLLAKDIIINADLEKNEIKVTDEEIEKEIEEYKINLGGEEEFKKYISTLGVEYELFEENIKNSLANNKHMEDFIKNNTASDDEIKTFYQQNKDSIDNVIAKHILLEDEETANQVFERLKNGESFESLSTEFSIDEAAKINGGNIGKVTSIGFDPIFVEESFKLQDGEISEPVKTSFGYHIILVDNNYVGVEKNRDFISNQVLNQKYNSYLNTRINELKFEVYDTNGKLIEIQNEQ